MAKTAATVIGLDFGTSTSLVARRDHDGEARIVPIGRTQSWLPSVAALSDGRLIVGEDALVYNEWMVRSVKRTLTFHHKVVRVGPASAPVSLDPAQVVVEILRAVTQRAREHGLNLSLERVIRLGCPAMWTRQQRLQMTDLAAEAGLPTNAITLVEEPVAAGLAWLNAIGPDTVVNGRVLVFDMGGGTLDLAVLDVHHGRPRRIAVLTSIGVPVAGDNLDDDLAQRLTKRLLDRGVPHESVIAGQAEILRRAGEAKHQLSATEQFSVVFDRAAFGGPRIPAIVVTRSELEELFSPHMDAAEHKVWDALKLARLAHARGRGAHAIFRTPPAQLSSDVDYVVPAGGMVRIPYVRRRLSQLLPSARIVDLPTVAPDEAIVAGLTDVSGADLVNLYRPGFDFTLTIDGEAIPLYEAYTPLFEITQLLGGMDNPSFAQTVRRRSVPRARQGELVVKTPDGRRVGLIDRDKAGTETRRDSLTIPIAHQDVLFRLYCDGHIVLADGKGHDHWLRVAAWPEILGPEAVPLPVAVPDPKPWYPFNQPDR